MYKVVIGRVLTFYFDTIEEVHEMMNICLDNGYGVEVFEDNDEDE